MFNRQKNPGRGGEIHRAFFFRFFSSLDKFASYGIIKKTATTLPQGVTSSIGYKSCTTDSSTEATGYVESETHFAGSFGKAFYYSYDAKGNVCGNTGHTYTYDGFGRLTSETKPSGASTSVTYDVNGNVLTKTGYSNGFTYGTFNRLTNYNGTTISYDIAGNPLNWYGMSNMQYTRRNLLTGATVGSTSVAYEYDGMGNRIKKTVGGETQRFYYSGNKLIARKDYNDSTWHFLYDNTGIYGFCLDGECYLFIKNMLGDITSIHQLVESGLEHVASYEYDAWGVCTVKNPDGTLNVSADFIGNLNPFRYRGYYYDTETGLYWLKTRHYDPKVGRFLTQDSLDYLDHETLGGLNLYAYCLNNPISYVDPTGHFVVTLGFLCKIALISAGIFAAKGFVETAIQDYAIDGRLFNDIHWSEYVGASIGEAIKGFGVGLALGLGAAMGAGATVVLGSSALSLGSSLVLGTSLAYASGALGHIAHAAISTVESFSFHTMQEAAKTNAQQGILFFASGYITGAMGLWSNLTTGGAVSFSVKVARGLTGFYLRESIKNRFQKTKPIMW